MLIFTGGQSLPGTPYVFLPIFRLVSGWGRWKKSEEFVLFFGYLAFWFFGFWFFLCLAFD